VAPVRPYSATALFLAVAACAAIAALPTAPATASTPAASWRCIAGICVGHSRTSVAYRFGGSAASNIPSQTVRVTGGRVWVCFWRCFNAVTEDSFTYYGGSRRAANRVLTVGTCDPIVRLPDGVTIGTSIPFGQYWNGYRRITQYLEGGGFGWEKVVSIRGTRTKVILSTNRGRVICVDLEQPR
jgi:hypothetical protein